MKRQIGRREHAARGKENAPWRRRQRGVEPSEGRGSGEGRGQGGGGRALADDDWIRLQRGMKEACAEGLQRRGRGADPLFGLT